MKHFVVSSALLAPLIIGCGGDDPPPATAHDPQSALGQPRASADRAATQVEVDDDIAKACNLPTPRFDFDSSKVRAPAKTTLDALATCLTSGPLKGKHINLVGHADPRGELYYNMALGQQRAGHIATYLTSAGVADERLSTTSRGELDATGSDESGWSRDRRVEISLAK
jgi:peptidoglycan-associated lipoprotein